MSELEQKEMGNSVQLGRVGERPFWVLSISILLRAVHQVGAAVFLASFLVKEFGDPAPAYFILTVVSGVLLFLAEGIRHRQIYRELSGWSTFLKLVLLGAAYHGVLPETITIVTAFLLASIGAHAPKIIRHRLLF